MVRLTLMPPRRRSLLMAMWFQLAWVIAAAIILASGGAVNLGLLAILIPLLWVPTALEQLTGTVLPDALHIHFHAFITASSVMGSTFGVYAIVPHWDTIVHIDSGILLAWLGLFVIQRAEHEVKATLPGWFVVSAALATPLAFAALWEVSEWLSDTFIGTTTQANLEDSIIDMLAALIGAFIAIAFAKWFSAPKSLIPRAWLKK